MGPFGSQESTDREASASHVRIHNDEPTVESVNDNANNVRLHARLMKLHGAENWAERYGVGIDTRAVLAGFVLAFTMQNIVDIDASSWQQRHLFEAYSVLLAVATSLLLFAVVVFSVISAVIARQIGRTQSRYGPDASTAIDHVDLIALTKGHANPNDWFRPGGSTRTAAPVDSSLELESLHPCAANWLNARSGGDGSRRTPKYVPTPRKLGKWAQWAFILALSCYLICMALKLADTLGPAYGIGLGCVMAAGLAAAITLLALNDGFDIN